jgi:hypothetical protein
MGLPLKSSDVVPDEESMSSDGGVLLLMVEAAADGSVHPRFLDQGFHRGVGMNELVSGVEWGRCDRGMWGPADRIGGLIFFFFAARLAHVGSAGSIGRRGDRVHYRSVGSYAEHLIYIYIYIPPCLYVLFTKYQRTVIQRLLILSLRRSVHLMRHLTAGRYVQTTCFDFNLLTCIVRTVAGY